MSWPHPTRRLEQALAGDLPLAQWQRLRRHLRGCPQCKDQYDQGVLLLRAVSGRQEGPGELRRLEELVTGALPAESGSDGRGRFLGWGLAVAGLLAVLGTAVWDRSQAVGWVLARSGEVWIDAREAEPGDRIPPGVLVSVPRGDALLQLEGDRQILLRQGAGVRVDAAGATAALAYGRARFEVDPGGGPNRFAVITDQARISVEGTIFVVDRQASGSTLVAVKEGQVRVRSPGSEVALIKGEQTTVEEGVASAPGPATAGALDEDRGSIDVLRWLRTEGARAMRPLERLFRRSDR